MSQKIAYLTGEYPRATDTFIQREAMALRDQGRDVVTCSVRRTGVEHLVGPEQRDEAARTFYVLEACKSPKRLIGAHWRALRRDAKAYGRALGLAWRTAPKGVRGRAYNLIYFLEAAVLADELHDQDVTHLHNHIAKASCTVAMLMSEMSSIPYSFTIHGPDIFFEPHHWRIDEKAARAAFVACISDYCRSQLMCFADAAHWGKLHIVHCGIDPARYAVPAPHTGQEVLFVGRLAGVKGVPVLLDAMKSVRAAHPDVRLTLIGDGPDRAALETIGGADFVGYKSQAEVADALARTDLFVLPSFAEGVPVVLMEAMAAGVPVVTTQIAGIPELVEHGVSGVLVPPGDSAALADAMIDVLNNPKRRIAMGAKGRAKVGAEFCLKDEAAWLGQLFDAYADGTDMPKRPQDET